jgi:branched-chain amino acid transport system permease protein
MVGAALVRYLNHYLNVLATAAIVAALPDWLHALLGQPLLIFGVIYLLLVYFFPEGIAGLVQRRRHPGQPAAPRPGLATLEPEAGGATLGGEDSTSP